MGIILFIFELISQVFEAFAEVINIFFNIL